MFVLPKSASAELWDGPRTGVEGAIEFFGADEAFDNTRFQPFFKKLLGSTKNIYMDNPGAMPTLLTNETTKKLIETGTFSSFFISASRANKRVIMTKQGPLGERETV
jgi:intermediate cleaving peptidase 55